MTALNKCWLQLVLRVPAIPTHTHTHTPSVVMGRQSGCLTIHSRCNRLPSTSQTWDCHLQPFLTDFSRGHWRSWQERSSLSGVSLRHLHTLLQPFCTHTTPAINTPPGPLPNCAATLTCCCEPFLICTAPLVYPLAPLGHPLASSLTRVTPLTPLYTLPDYLTQADAYPCIHPVSCLSHTSLRPPRPV